MSDILLAPWAALVDGTEAAIGRSCLLYDPMAPGGQVLVAAQSAAEAASADASGDRRGGARMSLV
jgi:hypothetical protein